MDLQLLFLAETSDDFVPSRNNQQGHIINILLTSFARSVRQVMDSRFIPSLFSWPARHKRKEKTRSITCCTDLALG